jgi:hypothetical protein
MAAPITILSVFKAIQHKNKDVWFLSRQNAVPGATYKLPGKTAFCCVAGVAKRE